jgi:hypothetical protein
MVVGTVVNVQMASNVAIAAASFNHRSSQALLIQEWSR